MSLPTLVDEWAQAARTLAEHPASEAAQRHANFNAHQLPDLSKWKRSTPALARLHKTIRGLLFDMKFWGDGPAGPHVARALVALADALQSLPPAEPAQEELDPETIPYRPGVGA